jgi:hypothetical protein
MVTLCSGSKQRCGCEVQLGFNNDFQNVQGKLPPSLRIVDAKEPSPDTKGMTREVLHQCILPSLSSVFGFVGVVKPIVDCIKKKG